MHRLTPNYLHSLIAPNNLEPDITPDTEIMSHKSPVGQPFTTTCSSPPASELGMTSHVT